LVLGDEICDEYEEQIKNPDQQIKARQLTQKDKMKLIHEGGVEFITSPSYDSLDDNGKEKVIPPEGVSVPSSDGKESA